MKILINVIDFETKKLIPARVVILKNNQSLFNWYEGFDGVYINGKKFFNLNNGKYQIKISAGNEYNNIVTELKIYNNKEYKFYLERKINMKKLGWWTGEGHSHIYRGDNKNINYEKIYLMMKAEGYDFLLTGAPINNKEEELYHKYKNSKSENERTRIEKQVIRNRRRELFLLKKYESLNFYFLNGLEVPKCRFGHLWWFNYPVVEVPFRYFDDNYDKWQFNKENRAEPRPQFFLYEFIKKIKSINKNSLSVYAHPVSWWRHNKIFITNIAAELLFDTYAGPVYDGIAIMSYDADNKYSQRLWFKILNVGYRIPGFAEMDICFTSQKMSEDRFFKTYYYTGDKNFSYKKIIAAAKKGNSFITSGPFLFFKVNSKLPGHVFNVARGNDLFKFSIRALSVGFNFEVISKVVLIKNGRIIKKWYPNKQEFNIDFQMKINHQAWFIVKCYGYNKETQVAITNPIYFDKKGKTQNKNIKVILKNYKGYTVRIQNKKINITRNRVKLNIPLLSKIEIIKSGKIIFSKKIIEFEKIYRQLSFLYRGRFVNRKLKSGEIPIKYFKFRVPTIVVKKSKDSKSLKTQKV